jgi:hypothetical protein
MNFTASHLFKIASFAAAFSFSTSLALADTTDSATPMNTEVISRPVPYFESPTFGPFTMHLGINSTNTGERIQDVNNPNGRRYELQNEDYVSLVHRSGWGLSLMYVTDGDAFDNSKAGGGQAAVYGPGDASVTLLMPTVYQGRDLTLTDQFRAYYPNSNWSASHEIHQYAYYLFANYNMPKGLNLWNQLTPRYFAQPTYGASDTTYFIEDYSALTQRVNSWLRYGVGQHSQEEWHYQTAAGTSVEVYPLVDFFISANVFIEPRLKFPLYEVNSVYDAPHTVGLGEMQGEVFVKIAI